MVILQLLGIVEADPASAGLELAPAGTGALTGLNVHDGEHADAGIGAGAAVVGTRTLADIQIPDADLHKEGYVLHLRGSRSGGCDRNHSSGSVIGRSAITEDTTIGQRVIPPRYLIAGVALNCVDLLLIHGFNNAGVRGVVQRRTEENLISRLRIAGMELSLILEVAQRVGASRACRALRLAEQRQRLLIAECRQETPVNEHVAPCKAVLLPVVPAGILLVEVSGVLGVVGVSGIGTLVIQRAVGGLLLVSDLLDGYSDDLGSSAGSSGLFRLRASILVKVGLAVPGTLFLGLCNKWLNMRILAA